MDDFDPFPTEQVFNCSSCELKRWFVKVISGSIRFCSPYHLRHRIGKESHFEYTEVQFIGAFTDLFFEFCGRLERKCIGKDSVKREYGCPRNNCCKKANECAYAVNGNPKNDCVYEMRGATCEDKSPEKPEYFWKWHIFFPSYKVYEQKGDGEVGGPDCDVGNDVKPAVEFA